MTPLFSEKHYLDLIAYITSNAIAGELMAIDNYTGMVPLLEDTDEKIETVKQAHEESRHVRMLQNLGRRLDFETVTLIVEPQWKRIRAYVADRVRERDLSSCLIAQDLMVETMAVVLYRTLCRDTDPDTRKLAGTILEDELNHIQIGIDRIKALMDKDPIAVNLSLIQTHNAVMPELLSMVSYQCESLCGVLDLECDEIRLDAIHTDLDSVRLEATDTYMELLDRVGFESAVTAPLFARMGDYEKRPWAESGGACCVRAN